MKLQRCWLRSFTPITESIYAHGDSLTCRLPATPSCLGIRVSTLRARQTPPSMDEFTQGQASSAI
ncbi:Uncharacterised protein [Vibrio cholerae]|nr:Uncharacterised protein [Vibrio cholerae]